MKAKTAVIRLEMQSGPAFFIQAIGRNGSIRLTTKLRRARAFTTASAETVRDQLVKGYGDTYAGVHVDQLTVIPEAA